MEYSASDCARLTQSITVFHSRLKAELFTRATTTSTLMIGYYTVYGGENKTFLTITVTFLTVTDYLGGLVTEETFTHSHPSYKHTNTHPFNGPFSGTTQVSRYQKGKTNLKQ